jgi:hypothetical protein
MSQRQFHIAEAGSGSDTSEVVARFIAAFDRKDAGAIADLVAPDCVMETLQLAPQGQQ